METTLLVRLEFDNGIGIFRQNDYDEKLHRTILDRHQNFNDIRQDFLYTNKIEGIFLINYYCAYKSVSQLKRWITQRELKALFKLGCNAYLLEVSKCIEGKHQFIYMKSDIINKTVINSILIESKKDKKLIE
jgi:hypothetical protein